MKGKATYAVLKLPRKKLDGNPSNPNPLLSEWENPIAQMVTGLEFPRFV
jgi:hypothetical protein